MKTWIKVLLIALIIAVPAFILGPIIWTPTKDLVPTPTQLPFFILLSAIESLLFGFGISFMIYGRSMVKNASLQSKNMATAAYFSLSWLLVSWWPHDNFHIHNGLYALGLLYIDYGFHVTLMIASLIVTYYILNIGKYMKPTNSKR